MFMSFEESLPVLQSKICLPSMYKHNFIEWLETLDKSGARPQSRVIWKRHLLRLCIGQAQSALAASESAEGFFSISSR